MMNGFTVLPSFMPWQESVIKLSILSTPSLKSPSVPRSNWIKPAQDFLENYQEGKNLYKACTLTTFCQPGVALSGLIATVPSDKDVLSFLRESGVDLSASGYFDFEDDGESERWFNVRHRPREKPEFWIIAAHEAGLEGIQVTQVESNPPEFEILEPAFIGEQDIHLQPAIFIDGKTAFHIARMPGTGIPYLEPVALRHEYPDRYLAGLQLIENSLFDGDPPKQVQKDLRTLATYPGLLCVNTWSCDSYYYLLGLASELAGDVRSAVDAYHRLWIGLFTQSLHRYCTSQIKGQCIDDINTHTDCDGDHYA